MDSDAGSTLKAERADLAQTLFRELQSATRAFGNDSGRLLTQETLKATAFFVARCLDARNPLRTNNALRGSRMPISAIVRQCHIDVFEFCRRFPVALRLLKPRFKARFGTEIDAEIEAQMNEWRTSLVHSIFLFKRYREIFVVLFDAEMDHLCENDVFRFGWLLFIVEKTMWTREQSANLQSRFHLLLVICTFLHMHTPKSLWHIDLKNGSCIEDGDRQNSVYTLHKIAQENRVPSAEWKKLEQLMTSIEERMLSIRDGHNDIQNQQSPSSWTEETWTETSEHMNLCLDPKKQILEQFLKTLDYLYSEELASWGECDERIFLEKGVFERVSGPAHQAEHQNTTQMISNLPGGRVGSQVPLSSPAVASVSLGHWLLTFDQHHSLTPSQNLQLFFGAQHRDLISKLQSMLTQTTQKLFPSSSDLRKLSHEASLGTKIFYHALERLMEKENQQHKGLDLGGVFAWDVFCKSVLACSLEIIVESFQMEHLFFPQLITALQLKPFELCKIIDTFVQVMWDLPPRLKTHLYQIEERIIESLAWQPGSSIYSLISKTAVSTPNNFGTIEDSAAAPFFTARSIPGLSLDRRTPTSAFKVVAKPRIDSESFGSSTPPAKPANQNQIPECLGPISIIHAKPTRGRAILEDFFRKHLKLASFRLLDFKTQLDLPPKQGCTILLQVYKSMKHALYEHTSLFYNRHLDQILLCALYGVCKVNNLSVTFRKLLHCYKNQSQHQPDTYRFVIVHQTNPEFQVKDTSSIIEFYNNVFVARMEPYLLSFTQSDESETEASPRAKENRHEGDPEPLACHRIAPWLISDTSHLASLLKGGRSSPVSFNFPRHEGLESLDRLFTNVLSPTRNTMTTPAMDESCRSSTRDDDMNEHMASIDEHISKRPRR